MMMVLVTFRAVLPRQLDAVALDAVDGADMCSVLADNFHVLSDIAHDVLLVQCQPRGPVFVARMSETDCWSQCVRRTLKGSRNCQDHPHQDPHGDLRGLSRTKARGNRAAERLPEKPAAFGSAAIGRRGRGLQISARRRATRGACAAGLEGDGDGLVACGVSHERSVFVQLRLSARGPQGARSLVL